MCQLISTFLYEKKERMTHKFVSGRLDKGNALFALISRFLNQTSTALEAPERSSFQLFIDVGKHGSIIEIV